MTSDPFRPAWWIRGPHRQTIWGWLTRSRQRVRYRRESLTTEDGDELLLDHVDGPAGSPRLLLLHGLEGSSYSVYVQGMASLAKARGWRATAINFRSCARDPSDRRRMLPNRRPRLYHSGETGDLDFVLATLHEREPEAPMAAVGASLGGNVLLKWLGENPGQRRLRAAATLSAPYDLSAGATYLEKTAVSRLYLAGFLSTLRPKAIETARRFPEAAAKIDLEKTLRSKTFWEFDEAANAPLHGFRDAADYYARASCLGYTDRITTPVLCISAEDDPFLPPEALSRFAAAASGSVELLVTSRGGHLGWVESDRAAAARYWAEETAVRWIAERLG